MVGKMIIKSLNAKRLVLLFLTAFPPPLWAIDASAVDEFARKVVDGLNNRNPSVFSEAVNINAVLERTKIEKTANPLLYASFKKGVLRGAQSELGQRLTDSLGEDGYAKLVHARMENGTGRALVRMDLGDDGFAYQDWEIAEQSPGNLKIVDWFEYAVGQRYSESLAAAYVMLVPPTSRKVPDLFARLGARRDHFSNFAKFFRSVTGNDVPRMNEAYAKLPGKAQRDRLILTVMSHVYARTNDMDGYSAILEKIAALHGDAPEAAFVLIDYYFLTEQYLMAAAKVRIMEKSFGVEDAGLKIMLANTFMFNGQFEEAREAAQRAAELDPQLDESYWTLFTLSMVSDDYAGATRYARHLEERFNQSISEADLQEYENAAAWKASEPYLAWKAGQSANAL